ncbi:MAG: hypothetical protein WEE36_02380 [Acidimicrobiia bacterium]
MPSPVIAVVHIHKTAGTTLAGVFKRSFGGRHCDVRLTDPAADHLTPDGLRQLRRWYPRLESILGHPVRAYAGLEEVVGEIRYVSFLRDPIVRTASHYQYDVQRGGVDLPFEDWITHDAVRDRQTRILAGPDGTASEAVGHLDRFAFVGRADRFDESLVMLKRFVGMPDVRYASKWVAPTDDIKKRLLADPEAVARISAVNQADLEVWDHLIHEVYPKQVARYGAGLAPDTAALEKVNSRMTVRRMYAHPRYAWYVAKWRWGYSPWVNRRRAALGRPTPTETQRTER